MRRSLHVLLGWKIKNKESFKRWFG